MAQELSLLEAIRTQRAIRRFSPAPVPQEAITKIIEAATQAPSGDNLQPWYFIVIRDLETKRRIGEYCYQETIEALAEARADPKKAWFASLPAHQSGDELMRHMGEVPVLILACVDPTRTKSYQPASPQSFIARGAAGAIYPAVQNLMLAARALNLGTCPTTRFRRYEKEIKELLGIPSHVDATVLIPVGYPAEGQRFGGKRRKPVEEVAFYDRWGEK